MDTALELRVADHVARALREDLADVGDITTLLSVVSARRGTAEIIAKAHGVIAGLPLAEAAFRQTDPSARIEIHGDGEGSRVAPGQLVLSVEADACALLAAERTALNFMQRLSGIATLTRRFVDAVAGTSARILDTRKTTPNMRALEKYAVRVGGGDNHRFGLYDQVLLKENHFAAALAATGESYEQVVQRVVRSPRRGPLPVIAEARDIDEVCAAVRGGAGIVLLDNFSVPDGLAAGVAALRETARACGRSVLAEASGGVNLESVRAIAACGVDRISIGALTHSAGSLDLSLLIRAESQR